MKYLYKSTKKLVLFYFMQDTRLYTWDVLETSENHQDYFNI